MPSPSSWNIWERIASDPSARLVGKILSLLLFFAIVAIVAGVLIFGFRVFVLSFTQGSVDALTLNLLSILVGVVVAAVLIAVMPAVIRSIYGKGAEWWTNVFRILALCGLIFALVTAAKSELVTHLFKFMFSPDAAAMASPQSERPVVVSLNSSVHAQRHAAANGKHVVRTTIAPGQTYGGFVRHVLVDARPEQIDALNANALLHGTLHPGATIALPASRYRWLRANGRESYRSIAARAGVTVPTLEAWSGRITISDRDAHDGRECPPIDGCAFDRTIPPRGTRFLVPRR
jgi:hypothetical protein